MRASQVSWHLAEGERISVRAASRETSYWISVFVMRKTDFGEENVAEITLFCMDARHQREVLRSITGSTETALFVLDEEPAA